MSVRRLQRERRRSREAEAKRDMGLSRLSKSVLGAGSAVGATVLFAPAAEAATFAVSNLNNAGAGSLRNAVVQANASGGGDTVVFQAGLSGTIQLAGFNSDIEIINDSLQIQGPGASQITVDGGGIGRIFELYSFDSPNQAVSISGLTLSDGYTTASGGALYSDSGGAGGYAADLTIADSTLTANVSDSRGGAVFAESGAVTITGSTLSGNRATAGGGGLYASDTGGDQPVGIQIRNSTLSENQADINGGGLAVINSGTGMLIESSTISQNRSTGGAGGGVLVFSAAGDVTVRGSTISGNSSVGEGGGLFLYGSGAVTVEGSTISGNRAADSGGGGAFRDSSGPVLIQNATISGNQANIDGDEFGEGGGILSVNPGDVSRTVRNSTIAANSAREGGGVYAFYDEGGALGGDRLTISSTILADNTASVSDADLGGPDPPSANTSFEVGHSLIEGLGETQINETPAGSNLLGIDPVLGPLTDNGGPTQTQLPALTSPALDAGVANGLATDQRTGARIFDASNIANATAGDGTDIGATELVAQGECKGKAATVLVAPGQPISGSASNDVIVATPGKDTVKSGGGKDTVCAGDGKDKVKGHGGKDTLLGQAGKDRLSGGAGKDKLKGGAGKDRLSGGGGKDRLSGGAGKDVLKGGPGKDKLNGGPGKDTERQ